MPLKYIELKVKKILKEKGWSMKHLCYRIDMTENGLKYAFKNNSLKISTLIEIADLLEVSPEFLLRENSVYPVISGSGSMVNEDNEVYKSKIISLESKLCLMEKEVSHLAERLKDKEQIIAILQNK